MKLQNSTLSFRVLVLLGICMSLLLISVITLGATAFKKDKLAYIYDLQDIKTEKVTLEVRNQILTDIKKQKPLRTISPDANPIELGLSKLPEVGEIYLSKQGTFQKIASGEIFQFSPILVENSTEMSAFSDTFVLNSFGEVFFSKKNLKKEDVLTIPSVKEFLSTNLRSGLVTLDSEKGEVIGGFREVSGTNLAVFAETEIGTALAPLRRFVLGAILVGIAFIFSGLFLCGVLLRALWKPVRELRSLILQVADGQELNSFEHNFKDELYPVFVGLSEMSQVLKMRERNLLHLQRNLENALDLSLQLGVANKKEEIIQLGMSCLIDNISMEKDFSAVLSLNVQKRLGFEVETYSTAENGKLIGEMKMVVEEMPALLNDSQSQFEFTDTKFKLSSTSQEFENRIKPQLLPGKEVVIPLIHGENRLGHIHFRGYKPATLSSTDEVFFSTVATSMAVAFDDLKHRETEANTIRLEAELEAASLIQTNLLPAESALKSLPNSLDVFGYYKAAERTGGDWYGFHYDELNDHFYFYVSDVTGHGIASALLTGVACGSVYGATYAVESILQSLKEKVPSNQNLDVKLENSCFSIESKLKLLNKVMNRTLGETGKSKYLMSMVFFGLDLKTGEVCYINAGHPSPYVFIEKTNEVQAPNTGHSLLGMNISENDSNFNDQNEIKKFQLANGDTILIYTDGLIENSSESGKMFSRKQLRNVLVSNSKGSSKEIVTKVLEHGEGIWKGATPADDVTVFALKRK